METKAWEICQHIMTAQREAGELLLHARGVLAACKTDHRDVVTQYDCQVQQFLVDRLREALPEAKFYCEENDQQDDLQAEHLFVIDPIDGTMNFVRHLNHSCISVAYMSRGQLLAGAVYNPYVEEMFHAVRGGGAFLNGKPIHTEEAPLSETLICVGTAPYRTDLIQESFRRIQQLCRVGLDIRRQGSAALDLCSVAAGRAGLYLELSTSLWDYAAGVLLVREAGGDCLSAQGEALPFDGSKPSIVAGSRQALADFWALPEA